MEKRRFEHEFAILFLLVIAVGAVALQSNFNLTGNVIATDNLQSISITTPADKLSYFVGDTLDITGLVITGTYADGSTQSGEITASEVSGFDSSVATTGQVLTITLGTATTTYTIDVLNAPVLQSISITTPATKLSYVVGETLDLTGLVVTGTYDDASTKVETITASEVSGFDSSVATTGQVLTITLGTVTTTYTIDVTAPATCTESWTCGEWSVCTSETQTRTCTDANSCGTTTGKPEESQSCTCVENWECTPWTNCSGATKTRTCTDTNSCGTETTIPSLSHECVETTSTESNDESLAITSEVIQSSVCSPNWQCGEWQECSENNQARACTDVNNCGTQEGIPATSQACVVEITATCSDKIKNQDETGIDCGGVCKKCSIFTMVGGVVNGPLGSVGQFFSNKTNVFIFSGALILVVVGFFCFKIFKKHRKK